MMPGSIHAQEGSPPEFKTDVTLTLLFATATDRAGNRIWDLDQNNFLVFADGVKQEIRVFERQNKNPLSIALLIDTSLSTTAELGRERASAKRFVHALLREDGFSETAIGLYTFDWKIARKTGFTRETGKLDRALWFIKGKAGTVLYDAISLAAHDMEQRPGRHVIVVVTDGVDTSSEIDFLQAVDAAKRTGSEIFPISTASALNDVAGEHTLTALAADTGGAAFSVASPAAIDKAFQDLENRFDAQYVLGYYSHKSEPHADNAPQIRIDLTNRSGQATVRPGACINTPKSHIAYECGQHNR